MRFRRQPDRTPTAPGHTGTSNAPATHRDYSSIKWINAEEIRAASLQFVSKFSEFNRSSKANGIASNSHQEPIVAEFHTA